jgi:phosphatidylserine/phosphatidylglycerophosphate/cardiolipin synthase-like enzyme
MSQEFEVVGNNPAALFTLKVHRGEGMALLAMNWKDDQPPPDLVGFAIEYKEPKGDRFFILKNRLAFLNDDGSVDDRSQPTTLAPIQMFRWVHFPRNAELEGEFHYRVTPIFMNDHDEMSQGDAQEARLELRRETYPGQLNVSFTRGFVSSQAFVDRYAQDGGIAKLLPKKADDGLDFKPTHPKADEALAWMGFEARDAILQVLDQAIADKPAKVMVVAYDLNEPEIVTRLEQLEDRVRVIIDDSDAHGKADSAESQAETRLVKSAGRGNVKRQHMGNLQHNKTIVVDGSQTKAVVCGSTNFSWRGFFVQANNAVVIRNQTAVDVFSTGFDAFWKNEGNDVAAFGKTDAVKLAKLGVPHVDAQVAFSPHSQGNELLATIGDDIGTAHSSVLYSMAFLAQTSGAVRDALTQVTEDDHIFVYGIADQEVGGIEIHSPDGNVLPVHPVALTANVPEPFKSEPTGGGGIRMHHKFVVIDFDTDDARVYLGSYNFSQPADVSNGENLVLIRDRRVAVAYAVEALRIFDHWHFRVLHDQGQDKGEPLHLLRPARAPGESAWWEKFYSVPQKARDREMFA